MKKLLILGGSRYIIPVIDTARKLGLYVITCDYLPDNEAHKYSDEYCNVSVIDKDAVLSASRRLNIDGIISFACDPGVVSAAYTAEKMGLPFQGSYESVRILQDKGLFRKFLADNGFNTPKSGRYTRSEVETAKAEAANFRWPVIVKPVDSAGSKGVTRVDSPEKLDAAIESALAGSLCGAFIIEEFLTFNGYHSSTDPFTVDGELAFMTFSDQLFDKGADNPYTPSGIKWPSTMAVRHQEELTREIQRLMHLLDMKTGIYNIETCVSSDDRPYIMEVSPRGGGCRIAEVQKLAYGVDLIENEVRKAVGMPLTNLTAHDCAGSWSEMVLHSNVLKPEVFKSLTIDSEVMREHVVLLDVWAKAGDVVRPFTGANSTLGIVFLHGKSRAELDGVLARVNEWLKIEYISGITDGGGGTKPIHLWCGE